jgi:tetratricopeptide (TPR) repeat protein
MASAIGDERRELAAIVNRAQAMNFAGTPKQSIEIAEPALERARTAQFRDLELLAWYIIGQANYAAGKYRQTADVLTERMPQLRGENSLARFGTAGTTSVLFLIMIGIASASMGEFDRSRLTLEEALEITQQTGRPYDAVACSYCRGILLAFTGQWNDAVAEFRKGLDLCRDYSINLFIPLIVGQLGAALTMVGLHNQAISLLERVVRESELLGHNAATVFANYALAAAYSPVGRVEESLKLATSCLENTQRYGFKGVEVRVLLLLGSLQIVSPKSDLNAAETFIKNSIDLARSLNALPNVGQGQLALAGLWAKTGRPEQAIEAIDSALHTFDTIGYRQRPEEISRLRFECCQRLSAPAPS